MDRAKDLQVDENDGILTDYDLGVLLERTRSAFSRMRELELAQHNLTPEQTAILHTIISKGGSATCEEIASDIIRQYHSVTTIVNRMLKIGLVRKEKKPNQKKFLVYITEKGESMYENVPRNSVEMIFSELSREEKRQLATSLQKLLNKGREILEIDRVLPFLSD
jgi:DNA-binding MarR family transcriptional regulator